MIDRWEKIYYLVGSKKNWHMFYMTQKKLKLPVPTSFIIKTQGNTIIFFSEFDSLNRLLRTTPIIYI